MSDVWFGSDRIRTNPLFWRYSRTDGVRAMLYGKWKLHVNKQDEASLYDLEADRAERFDLSDVENATSAALQDVLRQWESTLPANYCRLDERYEPCRKGIPLPFNASLPPTKMGPPKNVPYETVSYESAALLAPNAVIYSSSTPQNQELVYKPQSIKLCENYTPPTHAPTISPKPSMSASLDSYEVESEKAMIEEGILNDSVGPSSEGSTNGIRGHPAPTTSVPSFLQLGGSTLSILLAGQCLLYLVAF